MIMKANDISVMSPSSMACTRSCTSPRFGFSQARCLSPMLSTDNSSDPEVVRAMAMPPWFTRNATSGLADSVLSNAPASTTSE